VNHNTPEFGRHLRNLCAIYGGDDRIQWITGSGGHGNLGPISPAILGFSEVRQEFAGKVTP
jgi:hypothetical protein